MLISIYDQHMYITCLYLKPNLITINQSNQNFWDVFLIEKTVSVQCRQKVAIAKHEYQLDFRPKLQSSDWFQWSVCTMKQKGNFKSSELLYDYHNIYNISH